MDMKNAYYSTSQGTMAVALRRGGRSGTDFVWAEIDKGVDFELMCDYPGAWQAKWNPTAQTYYVRRNPSYGYPAGYLHRFILRVTNPAKQVDHRDHNGLNNIRSNLVVCTRRRNGFNRLGAQRGSKSGRRNVYWNQREQQYMVWFVHDGKRYYFGYFKDIDEADRVATKERKRFEEKHR